MFFSSLVSNPMSLGAVGTGLALAGLASMPLAALAADAPAAGQQASASGASNQVVVRDAVSGQLRAPTPDEALLLQAQSPAARSLRVAPAAPLQRYHSSGARGARLTDEFMSYSVMVRQPDGRLLELCFESREAAEAALKQPQVANISSLPTE